MIELLAAGGIKAETFEGVPEEAPCATVDQVRGAIEDQNSQLVVGLGGGSAMDTAKAAAILVNSDQPTAEHLLSQQLPDHSLPMIAIPTTAGTGSEVTPVAVLMDKKIKMSIRSDPMMPKAAIVDPELTISCSPELTAIAGMDAFVQALDLFVRNSAIICPMR